MAVAVAASSSSCVQKNPPAVRSKSQVCPPAAAVTLPSGGSSGTNSRAIYPPRINGVGHELWILPTPGLKSPAIE